MRRNEAKQLRGGPATLTQYLHDPCPTSKPIFTSSFVNMETRNENLEKYHVLANMGQSQGLHCTNNPLYNYSQLHLPSSAIQNPDHRSSPTASSNSNNNISDGARALIDDRKKKRMFSNTESARRSRMRKKQQIETLQSQVGLLQNMNHQLSQKLIYLLECNQQILQQSALLKERVSSLQVVLADLLVPGTNMEEANHIPNDLMAEPSAPLLSYFGA